MPREKIGKNVFDAALDRMVEIYEQGHRVVVSFSAGKDSGVCLELCILAARLTNRLPVDVVMRDEEIMLPGTYEYALRMAQRPEINFNWIYANQPIVNAFNRQNPYWWVFDPLLDPSEWVRQPPDIAYRVNELNIESMTIPARFPVDEGKTLFAVIGLRVSESRARMYGLFSSKGHTSKANRFGVRNVRPIYDWGDGDIWKAIKDNKWDYNEAYDVMARLGVPRNRLRIAPPTMSPASIDTLKMAQNAFPRWFDAVAKRCEGIRSAANYGVRSVRPNRRLHETWEQCFKRVCIAEAPQWIRERATKAMGLILEQHSGHSTSPLPESSPCYVCSQNIGSWKKLAEAYYLGDPFSMKWDRLPFVEPEYFRTGAGFWNGKPSF